MEFDTLKKGYAINSQIDELKAKLKAFENFEGKTLSICITGDRDDISMHDTDIGGETFWTIRDAMKGAIIKEIARLETEFKLL